MFEKLIVLTILFACVSIIAAQDSDSSLVPPRPTQPSANQTKCYICDSESSCKKPQIAICDQSLADSTRSALAKHFLNVPDVTNSQFECVKIKYVLKKNVEIAVSGCLNYGLNPCNLKPINTNLASASQTCVQCSKSLCNPAGTFSSSSVTIMSAIFGLLLLKSLHI